MRATPVARFLSTLRKGGEGSGFAHHLGRPGMRGGSVAAAHNDGSGGGDTPRSTWPAPGTRPMPAAVPFTAISGHEIAGTSHKELQSAARKYAADHFVAGRGPGGNRPLEVLNEHTGRTIKLGPRGVHKLTSYGAGDHLRMIPALPEMLKHAVHVARRPYWHDRPDVRAYHTLVAPLLMGGEPHVARLLVRENNNGDFYYDGDLGELRRPVDPVRIHHSSAPAGATMDVGDLLAHVNDGGTLRKAKALGAGERWITVHPNGPAEKGTPILIKIQPDGSAKVLGGAGGKLNHLRLHGVQSEADYRAGAQAKDKAYHEKKKQQAAQDKSDGLTQNKADARAVVRDQKVQQRKEYVRTVSDAMGWKDEDTRFPVEQHQDLTPAEQAQAEAAHNRALFLKAKEVVEGTRRRMQQDGEARAEAGLGEVPLTADDPETITVQNIDPVAPATKGLGFTADYEGRAKERGLTDEALAEEAAASRPEGAMSKKATAEKVEAELKAIREPGPNVDPKAPVDAKRAMDILKADKKLRTAEAAAREANRKIDTARAPVEPKAFILETKEATDEDVADEIENDLRTIGTRAFLDAVGEVPGGADSLGRHIGVGAFNSINALALATTGAAQLDRSVVDVLGIAGAAMVLARRLHTDQTAQELEQTRDAMETFHVDHYMAASDKALREARDWHEMAHEIELGEAATGAELAVAQELNAKRRDFTAAAQQALGTAYGEMEANAALIQALRRPKVDKVDVSLGTTSIE